jgi:hypothetical protein
MIDEQNYYGAWAYICTPIKRVINHRTDLQTTVLNISTLDGNIFHLASFDDADGLIGFKVIRIYIEDLEIIIAFRSLDNKHAITLSDTLDSIISFEGYL